MEAELGSITTYSHFDVLAPWNGMEAACHNANRTYREHLRLLTILMYTPCAKNVLYMS